MRCDGCSDNYRQFPVRWPFNCFNDKTRYQLMLFFNAADVGSFIIRFSLVCADLSLRVNGTVRFLVPILLFELLGSLPIVVFNIFYAFLYCCCKSAMRGKATQLWRCSTMTCIRFPYHKRRPQAILLMRIGFIIVSFVLKFMSLVLAAACSLKYDPRCTPYTVFAAFHIPIFLVIILMEFVHFFRLWTYNPSEKRNQPNEVATSSAQPAFVDIVKTHRRHLGFFPCELLNDQTSDFRVSQCQDPNCRVPVIRHWLVHHSIAAERNIDAELADKNWINSFIAYYPTTVEDAIKIAQNGFPYQIETASKINYMHLQYSILFETKCNKHLEENKAIICVRLNLGRIKIIDDSKFSSPKDLFRIADGQCDSIYLSNQRKFHIRMVEQIETWMIIINEKVNIKDPIDGDFYRPCL